MWTKLITINWYTFWVALDSDNTPFYNVTMSDNRLPYMSGYYNLFWLMSVKNCLGWNEKSDIEKLLNKILEDLKKEV